VKKAMIAVFVIFGLIVFSMPMAMATPYTAKIDDGPGSGPGGEFTITPYGFEYVLGAYSADTSTQSTFETFCLETNEFITLGQTYDATIDSAAIEGGSGGPQPDPLSKGTAWLYYQFVTGSLPGYDYGSGSAHTTSANELQNAIWILEQEDVTDSSNIFLDQVITKFGSLDKARADNTTNSSVKVLNLYALGQAGNESAVKQSQLVCVPDASIMWLLGPAFIMLGFLGRKKAKEYL
jgi:hypothetical protein